MNGAKPIVVALEYDGDTTPTVSARGFGKVAQQIVQIAKDNGVLVQQDEELVEVLAQLDLGDEIPESLYRAVAEVIAFAYILSGKLPKGFTGSHDKAHGTTQLYLETDLMVD